MIDEIPGISANTNIPTDELIEGCSYLFSKTIEYEYKHEDVMVAVFLGFATSAKIAIKLKNLFIFTDKPGDPNGNKVNKDYVIVFPEKYYITEVTKNKNPEYFL